MANEIVLPQLGKTMKEGTIVKVLVQTNDQVAPGDVLFEIETDKATLEMESPAGGFVRAILVEAGQTVPVQTPLLILGDAREQLDSGYLARVASHVRQAVLAETVAPPTAAAETGRLSYARTLRDIEAHARCQAAAVQKPELGVCLPLSRTQRIVAEKMLWSKRNIPCFYLNVRADVTKLTTLRSQLNDDGGVKYSINDFLMRALGLSIRHYPIMTGRIEGDHIQLSDSIDIGLAISTDDGVVAPVVRDCGNKTLTQISADSAALIERTRIGKLTLEDLSGGCMSISNLGAFGVDSFIPIVIPGQSSILGVGTIQQAVLPVDKEPTVCRVMNLTLSVDHKVINGAEAAQFLDFVKKLLEHPDELL